MDLTDGPVRVGVGRPGSESPHRDFDVARPELSLLTGAHEVRFAQVLDDHFGIDERRQGVQPLCRVVSSVGLEHGMNSLPVPLEQSVDQAEAGGEPGDTFGAREGPGQVDGYSKVLATVQDGLRAVDDLGPVRIFGRLDGVTGALLRLSPSRLLELEEGQVVLEIGATGRKLLGLSQYRTDVVHQHYKLRRSPAL